MGTLDNGNTVMDRTDKKDLYQKNLEALRKHHAELADMIDSLLIEEGRIKILDSESGHARVLYKMDDGQEVFIHSAEDPTNSAKEAMKLIERMDDEGIAVLFGFGLGYMAEAIFKKVKKGHILMIYEATPSVFKVALQTKDLTELLESDQVKIILGPDADNFSVLYDYHHHVANGMFWVIKHHPSAKLNEQAYDNFFKRLNEERRIAETGISTAVNLGKTFSDTIIANIPSVIRKPGVIKMKELFEGRPAIIVSAGPSLEKNVHLLKNAKGKAVIIAVDVVLPTLLPAGIIPDIVVAIDPLPDNFAMFKDNPLLKDVPFICFAQYTPDLVNIYPGPLFINSVPSNIFYQWLSPLFEDKGYIDCFGGSVSHLAFGAAEYIGANVIAMIGSDLSFTTTSKYHAGETTKLLEATSNTPAHEVFADNFEVTDIFGETKLSLDTLLSFRTSFENKIKTYKGTVINATEGGLPISGSVPMRLCDFIEKYCDLPEINTFSIISELTNENVMYHLDGIISVISETRDVFNAIKKHSSRVSKHIKKIKSMIEKGEKETLEFSNLLDKIEVTIEKIKHPLLNLLVSYNYGLELFLKRQDIQDIDEEEDKWEKLDKQLERGTLYYREIVKTINLFNKQLDKLYTALQREKRVNTILTDEALGQVDKYYRAGMMYKKSGMAAQAVRYLELAKESEATDHSAAHESHVTNDPKFYSLDFHLSDMYLKQFRFYEARDTLEKYNSDHTSDNQNDDKIAMLLKRCEKKIKEWENRKIKIGKIIIKAEANYGSHLESGYFYFRVKDYERALNEYSNAISGFASSPEQRDDRGLIEAYYGLAHTYLAIGDTENAVEIFEKAIEVAPDNPLLYRDLGLIAYQNNNIESAELFFIKAIELAPDDAEMYKPLAELYMSLNKKDKAVTLYEHALQFNPDNPVIQENLAFFIKETIMEAETL